MAGNEIKDLTKRVDALEKVKATYDRRWDAAGDAIAETNLRLDKINDAQRERVAELEKQVASLTKKG